MEQLVDLHTHSTASDGQYPPATLVEKAAAAGIQLLALTDHDTMDGLEEAIQAGAGLSITVLRGIELGAREDRHMHILGLNLSADCPELAELCRVLKASREERKYRILSFLAERGVPVSLEEVEAQAGGDVIARPHFAQVMVRRGYVSSVREAFDRYLDTDAFQKIERYKAPAADCIRLIHQAGGKAVLAHPYQLGLPHDSLEQVVGDLKAKGLDGLECFYPKHTPAMVAEYLALAKQYGLQVSGGSDFHGEQIKPDFPLAPTPLDMEWLGIAKT